MNAWDWVANQPWAITPAALESMLSIIEDRSDVVASAIEAVSSRKGEKMPGGRTVQCRDGVAIIPVRGPISRYMNLFDDICGGTSVQVLAQDIQAAVANPDVKAILLEIDSPGGQATGIGELAAQIRAATKVKPVCAYVGGDGCSAAYWLASACSEIVVNPTAVVGSVGAVITVDTRSKPGQVTIVSSQSPNKRPDVKTPEGKAQVQELLDSLAGEFIRSVAEYRGVKPSTVIKNYGAGGVKLGRDAVKAGMADHVGDFETTLRDLASGKSQFDTPSGEGDASKTPGRSPGGNHNQRANSSMNPFAILSRLFERDPESVQAAMDEAGEGETVNPAVFSTRTKSAPAFDAEAERARIKAEVEAELAEREVQAIAERAKVEADRYLADAVKAGKVKPADIPALTVLYVFHSLADQQFPVGYAGPDGKDVLVSRLDHFVGSIEATPEDKSLFVQHVAEDGEADERLAGFKVLPQTKSAAEAEDARSKANVDALLSTELGRSGLKLVGK